MIEPPTLGWRYCIFSRVESERQRQNVSNPESIWEDSFENYSDRDLRIVQTCFYTWPNCWASLLLWPVYMASGGLTPSDTISALFQSLCNNSFWEEKNSILDVIDCTVILGRGADIEQKRVLCFIDKSSCYYFARSDSILAINSAISGSKSAFVPSKAIIFSFWLLDCKSAQAGNPPAPFSLFCNRSRKPWRMKSGLAICRVRR